MEINANLLGKEIQVGFKTRIVVAVDLREHVCMRVAVTTDNCGCGYALTNSTSIEHLAILGSHINSLNWDWIDDEIIENQ